MFFGVFDVVPCVVAYVVPYPPDLQRIVRILSISFQHLLKFQPDNRLSKSEKIVRIFITTESVTAWKVTQPVTLIRHVTVAMFVYRLYLDPVVANATIAGAIAWYGK